MPPPSPLQLRIAPQDGAASAGAAALAWHIWRPWSTWAARWLMLLALATLGAALLATTAPVQAQRVELAALSARRADSGLLLDYQAKLLLSPPIEEALQRGVPLYFIAEAQVLRPRWYWRDERIARVTRTWRLSYQPLTASWRVGLGAWSQVYATLAEAVAPIARASGWRLVEPGQLEAGETYTVDFALRLDNTQLPRPMQLDLGGDWKLGIGRSLRVD